MTPQRLPNPALVGKSAVYHRGEVRHHASRPSTRVLIAPLDGVGRDYPALDREAVPGALLLRREGLARGLRALQADPAVRRHGPHDVHPLAERPGHPRVRPQEAGLPHRRQLADDARVDRADDRARSGDDARLRRLRRQHHVGQHLAAASAEHQAAGLRDHAGGQPVRPDGQRLPQRQRAGTPERARRVRRRRPASAPRRCPGESTSSSARAGSRRGQTGGQTGVRPRRPAPPSDPPVGRPLDQTPLDFVCEEDVRLAIQAGRKLVVSERAIVTPAARDLGEQHRVFTVAPWRG